MNIILECANNSSADIVDSVQKILLAIIPIGISYYLNNKIKRNSQEFERYKLEMQNNLDISKQRKVNLTETQKDILYVLQNIIGNNTKKKDVLEKIDSLIKETENKELDKKNLNNGLIKLFSAIGLNNSSEKVMSLRLFLQELSYERVKIESEKNYESLVAYSLLYKYLYLDYSGDQIDDLYLIRFNITDYSSIEEELKNIKENIYKKLKSDYEWE